MKNNAILSVFNCLVKFLLFTEIIAKIILIQLNYWEYISSKRNPVSPFLFFFFFFFLSPTFLCNQTVNLADLYIFNVNLC